MVLKQMSSKHNNSSRRFKISSALSVRSCLQNDTCVLSLDVRLPKFYLSNAEKQLLEAWITKTVGFNKGRTLLFALMLEE